MVNRSALLALLYLGISGTALCGLINPIEITSRVTPDRGYWYQTDTHFDDLGTDLDIYSFNYIFDLSSLDRDRIDDIANNSILEILDINFETPDTNNSAEEERWVPVNGPKYLNGTELVFPVSLGSLPIQPVAGTLKYRLNLSNINLSNVGMYQTESPGPEILAALRNESTTRLESDRYRYGVEVSSLIDGLNVFIWYDEGVWRRDEGFEVYRSGTKEWKTLEWDDAPYYKRLEFVPSV